MGVRHENQDAKYEIRNTRYEILPPDGWYTRGFFRPDGWSTSALGGGARLFLSPSRVGLERPDGWSEIGAKGETDVAVEAWLIMLNSSETMMYLINIRTAGSR